MWGSVGGGVGKCVGVEGSVEGGVEKCVGGGVRKCVGVGKGDVGECWGRCGKVCWGVGGERKC